MKTPREILLARHRHAESKLDAIRREVLADSAQSGDLLKSSQTSSALSLSTIASKIWRELIWPCRRIWTGMAAVWLMILGLHLAAGTDQPPGTMVSRVSRPGPEIVAAVRERRELMAQLIDPFTPLPVARPKIPGPRGSVPMTLFIG